MSLTLPDIDHLFTHRGVRQYGMEAVSQLDHALQCAHLAEQAGEAPETIAACLLHDLGHLLVAEQAQTEEHDTEADDLHQYIALPFLRARFPDSVLEPIRLHVDAKRYLCLIDHGYFEALSPASKHSLSLQGGVFSEDEAERFIKQAHADEAVRLRRYDDLAKVNGKVVPPLPHFAQILAQVSL
jgi:phosphonate degradation associated HDIG domain protein